jgi:cell division initiation protein
MKVTPLDLRQNEFRIVMRGYAREDVRAFLDDAADSLEQVMRDLDKLRDDMRKAEADLVDFRDREVNLRNTLLTAQRLADQIRENAEQEGKMIVREAEGRADLLLQKTQARLEEMEREIHELKLRRRDVEGSLEASISALTHALQFIRQKDQKDKEERVLIHRPRQAGEPMSHGAAATPLGPSLAPVQPVIVPSPELGTGTGD